MDKGKGKNNNRKKENFFLGIIRLLKLETTTPYGKVNLAGIAVIAGFCILYTTSDVIHHLISAIEDTVKTIATKKDVYHEYQMVSVFRAVIPIFLAFALCLYYLYLHEKNKIESTEEDQ